MPCLKCDNLSVCYISLSISISTYPTKHHVVVVIIVFIQIYSRDALSSQTLLNLDKQSALRQAALAIKQVNEAVTMSQTVQPHTSPSSEVIANNLVISYGEANPRQLINNVGHAGEREALGTKIRVAAAVGLRADLVLTLALVAIVGHLGALELFRALDVQLDLDVGLETLGGGVARGQGDVLRCEDGYGELERFADDGVGGGIILFPDRTITCDDSVYVQRHAVK